MDYTRFFECLRFDNPTVVDRIHHQAFASPSQEISISGMLQSTYIGNCLMNKILSNYPQSLGDLEGGCFELHRNRKHRSHEI